MIIVSVSVPVPLAVPEHYAAMPIGDLGVVHGKLGGRVLLLSWPLLLTWPTADAAAVGRIVGAAKECRRIGATGRPEAALRSTEPKERPLALRVETHRGLCS